MLGPEIVWNPENAAPPAARAAVAMVASERQAAMNAPVGDAAMAGMLAVVPICDRRVSLLQSGSPGACSAYLTWPESVHNTVERPVGPTATAGSVDSAGATESEIDVPRFANAPLTRSFASISRTLGTSVWRDQTTVACPPSPTSTCSPVIELAPCPKSEMVAGVAKPPVAPTLIANVAATVDGVAA
ncbi:MAG: hypothetical protein ACAH82_13435, partial [Solirubrobacteraceae bacterium]